MTAEIDRRVEELASTQLGLFAVRQVLLLGGTHRMIEHRLRSGRWQLAGHGVLCLLGTPSTYDRKVMSDLLGALVPAWSSHRCAARLHRLPGYQEVVEMLVLRGSSRVRRAGVICHTTNVLPGHHRTCVHGIPTTTVARTLFDLSAVVRPLRVARSIDTALARRQVTLMQLSRVARDLGTRGRRRCTVIRSILAERGLDFVAPASELEHEFVDLLAATDLAQLARQVDLGDDAGWIGRVDFVDRRARVVVETDGKEHHSSLTDRMADEERDRRLHAAGWTVLRFGWFDIVHDPKPTVAKLRRALQHGREPDLGSIVHPPRW